MVVFVSVKESLHSHEKRILLALGKGLSSEEDIIAETGLAPASVMHASLWLYSKGLVGVKEDHAEYLELNDEGLEYLRKGLPERLALKTLKKGELSVGDLSDSIGADKSRIAVTWLMKKRFAVIEGGVIRLTPEGREHLDAPTGEEKALEALKERRPVSSIQKDLLKVLESRGKILKRSVETKRSLSLTAEGKALVKSGIAVEDDVNVLTPEMIKSGSWRVSKLRAYDVTAVVPRTFVGKKHPLRATIDDIRRIFLEMGFTEIKSPIVESAFWNFDALFVPQDHPGRELQDTFYVPGEAKPPAKQLVSNVKKTHEDGWKTGSTGWGYEWNARTALERVLRTHTTAATCRALAEAKEFPEKVFCVDRVFRNETIDYKHLAEFYQVEGILIDKGATLADLFGLLEEFYTKMGYEDVRFRPAYFPYTEPSMEVEVYDAERKQWMELGGAGVFRPEVTKPLGVDANVLAWGQGLERIVMGVEGLRDIRTFYRNDLNWIRKE
ncbi:MAG: phenylalanine--tRNA ligase subunit alpha [Candidatus Diapherotrites archaeon]|nr:phenylalanine--tRNA ligase subunit alpha [Candidatus Diapherotrites archaeon]